MARPRGRAGVAERFGVVVLAARVSRRLGRPKQLLDLGGRPLLQHALDAASAASPAQIVVVLGHLAPEIRASIDLPVGAAVTVNPEYATGQASSLRAGIDALGDAIGRAVIVLGDQPRVTGNAIRAVALAPGPIARATYGGVPGHPVGFDRELWPELTAVDGDRGARDLLVRCASQVTAVELGGEPPSDVDTDEDYRRLTSGP
jgi:CTP:molybdopterin cytidylyltransferase MocA